MTESKKLWGGRFTGKSDETFAEFNNSFRFDLRLFGADVRASIGHALGLKNAGVLNEKAKSKTEMMIVCKQGAIISSLLLFNERLVYWSEGANRSVSVNITPVVRGVSIIRADVGVFPRVMS